MKHCSIVETSNRKSLQYYRAALSNHCSNTLRMSMFKLKIRKILVEFVRGLSWRVFDWHAKIANISISRKKHTYTVIAALLKEMLYNFGSAHCALPFTLLRNWNGSLCRIYKSILKLSTVIMCFWLRNMRNVGFHKLIDKISKS